MLAALTASLVALPLQARDTIQIVGSSTVYPFATVVAEKLGKKTGKTPVIESTGTGGGMKLFCAGLGTGHPDFTNASRAIKSSEKKLCASNGVTDIIEIIEGNDGIAFANSASANRMNFCKAFRPVEFDHRRLVDFFKNRTGAIDRCGTFASDLHQSTDPAGGSGL